MEFRLSFQGENEDLDLKCCMEGRKLKNNISGRKIAWGRSKISQPGGPRAKIFLIQRPQGRGVQLIILGLKRPTLESPK